METLSNIVGWINSIVWSPLLVALCLGAGLFLSVRLRFPQLRYWKEMALYSVMAEKSASGISPFQAFATTVGSRVGMGNLAGVATAIYFGGPGSVFWMWLITFLGTASAFLETVLAQAYKTKKASGEYVGGPAYFIEHGMKMKWLAVVFAVATVTGPGIAMPGLHTHSIAATFQDAFGMNQVLTGSILCMLLGLVVCGGVKRIGCVAELLAPIMCVVYVLLALGVCVVYFAELPAVFATIFKSAFGMEEAYSGIVGAMIAWGVKRGIYSNEAGQGSGAIVAAAAECSHPATQGLVQIFSVYVDTLIICTASAVIILATGTYNVVDGTGATIVNNVPGVQYGILYVQQGLTASYSSAWAGKILAVAVVMFVFTSLMGYYYQAESNVAYLFKDNSGMIWLFRGIFLASTFSGILINGEVLWSMSDIGVGLMAWINIIAILFLSASGVKILDDFERQRKEGTSLSFDPSAIIGFHDEAGVWTKK